MMAITVTWINTNYEVKEAVIAFRELDGQHTGLNIANTFHDVLKEFQVDKRVSLAYSLE